MDKTKSNYTVKSTPLDSGLIPTLGVTLWLGWTGAPILMCLIALLLPVSTLFYLRSLLIGLMIASILLPRSFGTIGDRIGSWMMRQAEAYFGLTTTIEDEQALRDISNLPLNSSTSSPPCVIFAFEPHDLIPFPVFAFNPSLKRLPGRIGETGCCLITGACFKVPFMRQVYSWVGCHPIDKATFRHRLERGLSLTMVPGGVQEVISMMKDRMERKKITTGDDKVKTVREEDIVLYLKNRKGFVKLALEYGVSIVPVFGFHIDESFGYFTPPDWSIVRRMARSLGMLPVFYWGRWGIPYGIPKSKRVHVVIGKPISIPREGVNVTDSVVDHYHSIYMKELVNLFERHKHNEGYDHKKIRLE
jgi:hypothetical protein